MSNSGTPEVLKGGVVLVLVRDQGVTGGGNAADRVVASAPGLDLLDVRDGVVHGQAAWADLVMPLADFEADVTHR
ncbi:MAG: hypothetical protein QOI20_2701 [Acidimicrobiaceae bacterium]|nr:hypothetical protein [Acidimicrobiaceae bacterium]